MLLISIDLTNPSKISEARIAMLRVFETTIFTLVTIHFSFSRQKAFSAGNGFVH